MKKIFASIIKSVSVLTILALLAAFLPPVFESKAGTLTTAQVRLNRQKQSQTSGINFTVVFTTAGAVSGGAGANSVLILFPDADDELWCRTAGALGFSTISLPDSATALPNTSGSATCFQGSGSGSAVSNRDRIQVTNVDNLSAATKYGFNVTDDGGAGITGTPTTGTTGQTIIYTKTDELDDTSNSVDNVTIDIEIISEDQVSVSATVNPSLTFTINTTAVNLGTLTSSTTGSGTTSISNLTTNAASGLVLTYNGATLTSGSNTINVMSNTTSSQGTEQFGINLKDNATPDVGTDHTCGTGSISLASGYGTANNFTFVAGATTEIITATAPVSCSSITISYIANVAGVTESGTYSTTITYIATGKF